MRDHKKLRAFELADQLAMLTYKQTASCQKTNCLTGFSNASGCGFRSLEHRRRLLSQFDHRICKIPGSRLWFGREIEYQISLAERLYPSCASNDWSSLATETCKVLNGLMRSLRDRDT